jgi:hypothetical protein
MSAAAEFVLSIMLSGVLAVVATGTAIMTVLKNDTPVIWAISSIAVGIGLFLYAGECLAAFFSDRVWGLFLFAYVWFPATFIAVVSWAHRKFLS